MMDNMNKTNLTEENVQENLTEENVQENLTEENVQENLTEENVQEVSTEENVQENLTEESVQENPTEGNTPEDLSLEDMEEIAGGTVDEYADLLAALSINPKLQKWGRFAAHLPGGNLVGASASDGIKGILKEIDIKVDLSLGLGGTGLFSSKNKYTRISTGESMTHEEVIAEMKRHFTLD